MFTIESIDHNLLFVSETIIAVFKLIYVSIVPHIYAKIFHKPI